MDIVKQTRIPDNGWTQHYDVVKELGDCYASTGDYQNARDCYDKAATLAPDEAGPYVGAGVVAFQQGRIDDAELAFKVALRLEPGCGKALCGLAMIYQQNQQLERSFELYLKSLETDSDNLTALLGLFQISCRMGSFSKVICYLEMYLQRHPCDVSVMFCLAALYHKDGNSRQAEELLKNILALDADNKDACELLEEVEHALAQNN